VQLNLGATPKVSYLTNHNEEDWKVTMVDTGAETMTGGRIRRVLPYIDSDTFLATYGDGVTDSDINGSIDFHFKHGKLATLTAVQLAARFGDVVVDGSRVTAFKEKTKDFSQFINGGFFVFDKRIGEYLKDDTTVLEQEPLTRMAAEGQIHAYQHTGFWQCMDTYREQQMLDKMYVSGQAPWKIW
jgi:glucose-1-phosphate cytidylyltransferase